MILTTTPLELPDRPFTRKLPESTGSIDQKGLPGPPKVCKIMAFMAIVMGLGLLFYILLGFR